MFTKTEFVENPVKIHHKERILALGSCFAQNIGQKLVENKFTSLCNPFGIVYNPISVSSCIERLQKNSKVHTKELQLCQDYYCHLDFHSRFNGIDKEATLKGMNHAIVQANSFEKNGLDWLIISLGTAFAYRYNPTNQYVNNCHKIPAKEFTRELLPTLQIVESLNSAISPLRKSSPNLKLILTVSPIRHTRDGLTANLRSKSRLIEAAHLLTEQLKDCYYFPSYEIVNEELRDYRWFDEDLIHPNQQAIKYVWDKFQSNMIAEGSVQLIQKVQSIRANLNHKPFLAKSKTYQDFLNQTEEKIEALKEQHPTLVFEEEMKHLEILKQGS